MPQGYASLCEDPVKSCCTGTLVGMATRNVTLSLPEDVFRRAKVLAAERDTSVSALVTSALRQLTGADDWARTWANEEKLMETGIGMKVGNVSWSRDELHER